MGELLAAPPRVVDAPRVRHDPDDIGDRVVLGVSVANRSSIRARAAAETWGSAAISGRVTLCSRRSSPPGFPVTD